MDVEKITTIALRYKTKLRLSQYGKKGESWDTVINDILDKLEAKR